VETPTLGEATWEMRITWVAEQSKRVFTGRPGYDAPLTHYPKSALPC
jgi:hypothetical protein